MSVNKIYMRSAFLLLLLVYIAANGYLFLRVWQTISGIPFWCKVIIAFIFWIMAFSMFAAVGMRDSDIPDRLLKPMFRVGAIWMAFLLYMVMLLLLLDFAGIFIKSIGNPLLIALPVTLVLLGYGYIHYSHPEIENIEISLEKKADILPVRIAAVSDIHLGYGTDISSLEKYVDLINSQKPDLVLIAGDLIDNSVGPLQNEPYAEVLSAIDAPLGVYMVPGNHEYISGIEACKDFLDNTSVKLLVDSLVTLPGGIQLIGRDDRTNSERKSLEELLSGADRTRPVIVLDHQPYELGIADSLGVDIQISGHTHRGQLWPLSIAVDHMYEQSHGYRKWSAAHIWVSSGLSLWGPPFRIGTDSEMAVFILK